ncbi:hypothetical protein [Paraburkholderia hospita]|uniref:hypothetical protein n=1 Tax=Paraburkholderia hospita TaxID=169430 RepID=UPI003ECCA544
MRIPDIAFALICNPEASWQRAHQRTRRLDSKVIDTFKDHDASISRFERFAMKHGWRILRSDTVSADELSQIAVEAIQTSLRNVYKD